MRPLKHVFCFLLIIGCLALCSCDSAWTLNPGRLIQPEQQQGGHPVPQTTSQTVLQPETIKMGEEGSYRIDTQEPMTLVQKAKQLSDKCEKIEQELMQELERNQKLLDENTVLKRENGELMKELKQTNDLLVNMRIEFDGWKTEAIQFRKEIRYIEKAQLEAIYRILKQLGGKEPGAEELELIDSIEPANNPTEAEANHEIQN